MKLIWAKDRKHVILRAETRAEIAFCDLVAGDLNGHKYKYSETIAEYMIQPETKKGNEEISDNIC